MRSLFKKKNKNLQELPTVTSSKKQRGGHIISGKNDAEFPVCNG